VANLPPGNYAVTLWFTNLSLQLAQSRQVVLDVVTPPVITSQPASQTVLEGATATFTVSTATNALLFYQWQHDNGSYSAPVTDGRNISGANLSTLTISNAGPSDVGAYSVLISNVAGQASSSNAFLAIVPWRPIIATHPASQSALPGQTVTLTVAAIGSQPLSYYWLRNGAPLTNGGTISGSRAPNLTLANVSSADAAPYCPWFL
jgi:hypothetical protein